MSEFAECRQQGENCRQQAALTSDPANKAHWLRIAQAWTVLANAADAMEGKRPLASGQTLYELSPKVGDGLIF